MVLKKDQQNCIQPVWGIHDEPIASENFSANKKRIIKEGILQQKLQSEKAMYLIRRGC